MNEKKKLLGNELSLLNKQLEAMKQSHRHSIEEIKLECKRKIDTYALKLSKVGHSINRFLSSLHELQIAVIKNNESMINLYQRNFELERKELKEIAQSLIPHETTTKLSSHINTKFGSSSYLHHKSSSDHLIKPTYNDSKRILITSYTKLPQFIDKEVRQSTQNLKKIEGKLYHEKTSYLGKDFDFLKGKRVKSDKSILERNNDYKDIAYKKLAKDLELIVKITKRRIMMNFVDLDQKLYKLKEKLDTNAISIHSNNRKRTSQNELEKIKKENINLKSKIDKLQILIIKNNSSSPKQDYNIRQLSVMKKDLNIKIEDYDKKTKKCFNDLYKRLSKSVTKLNEYKSNQRIKEYSEKINYVSSKVESHVKRIYEKLLGNIEEQMIKFAKINSNLGKLKYVLNDSIKNKNEAYLNTKNVIGTISGKALASIQSAYKNILNSCCSIYENKVSSLLNKTMKLKQKINKSNQDKILIKDESEKKLIIEINKFKNELLEEDKRIKEIENKKHQEELNNMKKNLECEQKEFDKMKKNIVIETKKLKETIEEKENKIKELESIIKECNAKTKLTRENDEEIIKSLREKNDKLLNDLKNVQDSLTAKSDNQDSEIISENSKPTDIINESKIESKNENQFNENLLVCIDERDEIIIQLKLINEKLVEKLDMHIRKTTFANLGIKDTVLENKVNNLQVELNIKAKEYDKEKQELIDKIQCSKEKKKQYKRKFEELKCSSENIKKLIINCVELVPLK